MLALALTFAGTLSVPAGAATGASTTQKRLNAVAGRLSRLQSSLEITRTRIGAMQKSIRSAEGKLGGARKGLRALTQGMYMGALSDASAFLSAESMTQYGDRVAFIEHLRASDRDTLQRVTIARVQIQRRQKALAGVLAKQRELLKTLGRERATLSKLFREQVSRLRAIEQSRRGSRRRASRSTPVVINGRGPFSVCPVDQPRGYSNDFGAPRGSRRHQGNDILAPRGTPIRAPFDGTVQKNSSGMGGLQVRVHGAQGYVFNAHLNSFSDASGRVQAGTVIGYVGDSGNARGGPTHDHFEWHPGGGRAVNPFPYLNLVC